MNGTMKRVAGDSDRYGANNLISTHFENWMSNWQQPSYIFRPYNSTQTVLKSNNNKVEQPNSLFNVPGASSWLK